MMCCYWFILFSWKLSIRWTPLFNNPRLALGQLHLQHSLKALVLNFLVVPTTQSEERKSVRIAWGGKEISVKLDVVFVDFLGCSCGITMLTLVNIYSVPLWNLCVINNFVSHVIYNRIMRLQFSMSLLEIWNILCLAIWPLSASEV